ncbi:MAG: hypothetical protein ACLFST_02325 [Spirochaetia bacterium]
MVKTIKRLFTYAVVCGAVLLLISCPAGEDLFTEYRGVNLIENQGFESGDWQVSYGEASPAFDYLRFEPVSTVNAGTTDGLPAGTSSIHRLELVNLFPNGDFVENSPGDIPAGWELRGPVGSGRIFETTTTLKPDAGLPMEGNVLHFKLNGLQWSIFNFDDPETGLLDGFIPNSQYFIQFDSSCQFPNLFSYTDLIIVKREWAIGNDTSWSVTPFPPPEEGDARFTTLEEFDYFSIGLPNEGNNAQEGFIDNIRVGRTDIEQKIILQVPISDPEELRPDLVDGHYRFSFYIKLESAGMISPAYPNRFDADSISLSLKLSMGEEITQFQSFFSDEEGWSRDEWTKITFQTPKVLQFDIPDEPDAEVPHLEIALTPTNSVSRDIGSILIAAPSLTYEPDGFTE